jgi:hypothetical protein
MGKGKDSPMKLRVMVTMLLASTVCAVLSCGRSASTDARLEIYQVDAGNNTGRLVKDTLLDQVDTLAPVPELAITGYDPDQLIIVFSHLPRSNFYRRPFLLKKGDQALLVCFDSPFFSSINPLEKDMDAVFWYPFIESRFGGKRAPTPPVADKVVFIHKNAAQTLKTMLACRRFHS